MTALPAGWVTTTLGDLALEVRNGISAKPDQDAGLPILRISAVRPMKLDASDVRYLPAEFRDADTYALRTDDLLFTRYNGNRELVGACARVHAVSGTLTYPDKLIRVRLHTRAAMPAFIEAAACAQGARDFIDQQLKTSAGQVGVSGADLQRLPLPLAPLAEQQRIADKLDAVVARVDACRDRLARVTPLLKRFRQSVLAAAVGGQLTADLFEGRYAETFRYPVTPLAAVATSRLGKMLDRQKNTGTPVRYLGNINVRWFHFDLDNLQELRIEDHEVEQLAIRDGDLLVCEGGEPGRCAVWSGGPTELVFQKALHRVRVDPTRLLPVWLAYYLKHACDNGALRDLFTGSTIKHLTGIALARIFVPLPGLEEQAEIVRRVAVLFAFADRLEARLAKAQAAADRLTPALLAKAFRGELVPQDPADEPAAVLLQRLAASRPEPAAKARRPRAGQGD